MTDGIEWLKEEGALEIGNREDNDVLDGDRRQKQINFWERDNKCLILKFESMVPVLVACSAFGHLWGVQGFEAG